jgi:hypothetical protein
VQDDIFHRLWECPRSAWARAGVKEHIVRAAREAARAGDRGSPLFTRALCTHPVTICTHKPNNAGFTMQAREGIDPNTYEFKGDIYVDGSAVRGASCELDRAGWALVAMGADMQLDCAIYGPVWAPLPQTSQAAEFCAAGAAFQVAGGPFRLVSDSASVVKALGAPIADQLSARRVYAGILRDKLAFRHDLCEGVQKVKSHLDPDLEQHADIRTHILGNALADQFAKLALESHECPDIDQLAAFRLQVQTAKVVLRLIADLAPEWPKGGEVRNLRLPLAQRQLEQKARSAAQPVVQGPPDDVRLQPAAVPQHAWRPLPGFAGWWKCSQCREASLTPSARPRACTPLPSLSLVLKGAESSHEVVFAATFGPHSFVICLRCGAWGEQRARKLAEACKPVEAGATGAYRVKRFLRGLHPTRSEVKVC